MCNKFYGFPSKTAIFLECMVVPLDIYKHVTSLTLIKWQEHNFKVSLW